MKNKYASLRRLGLITLLALSCFSLIPLAIGTAEETTTTSAQKTQVKDPFCDEKVIHKQKFAENDLAMSLVDIRPMQEGHMLVVTKRHVRYFHELTDKEMAAIREQIERIYKALRLTKGPLHYIILNKNGKLAGQTVPHVHVHFVPIFVNKETSEAINESSAFMDAMHSLNLYFWSFVSTYMPRLTDEELAIKVQEMKDAMAQLDEQEKNKAPRDSESLVE